MWRNIVSNFLTLLIVILVALGGLVAWAKNQYVEPGPLAEAMCLRVAPGESLQGVSSSLKDKGAISSSYLFRTGAQYEEKADKLKFGSYLIEPNASMQSIVGQITSGGPSTCGSELVFRIGVNGNEVLLRELDPTTGDYQKVAEYNPESEKPPEGFEDKADRADVRTRVTVVDGVTSWQIVQGLQEASFLSGKIDGVPGEGTLAPDSYEVTRGADRQALIGLMADRQSKILADAWDGRAEGLPYDDPQQALTMASIVEKETGVPEERPEVASVFINRLEKGMRLQTDPTVIYGVTEGKGVLGRGLRQSELRKATPYNTYVIDGLPPGPIANPGKAAIEAAMHPDSTDYLFFVADGSGGHAFSSTIEEHNRNVAKWREIEKQRQEDASSN
ncbi:endolytic transglycosylase MltG [Thioclava sp. DLFJ4-1]|uniref:endolytic transglycosylase MltG n=1 Tax=Thioclava sp. DLFJ4-1 TaxID=1915313 RepID=UPI000995E443|nr:endolytic transglycosylase MltG [Thioclava sp. DLFJ4-1]OOY15981.1 branched-chain alpha-keto acid dehydrogenase subunit E2 [Thioclava sp. DLFJ4-1]